MSEENVEIVRRCVDAWNGGDVNAWLEPMHPEIEWFSEVTRRVEGSETVYRGPTEMHRYWDQWHDVWKLVVDISEYRHLGDTVVALGRVQAHGGASGIDLEQPVAYVFEFEGDLVRKARSYLDPEEALEASGLSE
jgi:ketosteroid isomerase-like protein